MLPPPWGTVTAAVMAWSLAGCASLSPQAIAQLNQPIETALTTPTPVLRERAEAGNAQAQLALSVALQLRPGSDNRDLSRHWRMRAMAARGFTPLTLYVAGYKGHPSRVSTTLVPRYDVSSLQAVAIGACTRLLSGPPADLTRALDQGVCGGRTNYDRLALLKSEADRSASAPRTP